VAEEAAFLQTIVDNPDDDTPRLIYADWLEEHGDPRAEFIRVQCELARLPDESFDNPDWRVWKTREHQLRSAYEKEWAGPLLKLTTSREFHRGFIDDIAVEAPTFLRQGDAIFHSAPITKVRILEGGKLMHLIAASVHLARLTVLQLNANYIDDDGIESLVRSPHAQRLQTLHLGHNNIRDRGARALADSANMAQLTNLNLSHNLLTGQGALALANSRHLTRLTALDVSHNFIGWEHEEALRGRFGKGLVMLGQGDDTAIMGLAGRIQRQQPS
jgi:uncharacterized protein (TIGR02996 family)